ncbi:MAG: hypothetical protein II503_00195, partial [Clostridia bacterium]|nr:hypothetical protein [Clostridia bacterium]
MNERQYRQIRIPMWVIALLFFINLPLAIILLIVRSVKIPVSRPATEKAAGDGHAYVGTQTQNDAAKAARSSEPDASDASQSSDKKKAKMTAGVIISLILGIVFATATLGAAVSISARSILPDLIKVASFAAVSLGSFGSFFILNGRRKREQRYTEWIGDQDVYDLRTLSYATGVKK